MPRTPPREDRRVIAIQMLPKAYDEIQRLKGEETWTKFIIECALAKVGDNSILQDELSNLPKPKEPKPKAEKKGKKAGKAEVPGKRESTGTENKGGS
jgi:hypothetical protein